MAIMASNNVPQPGPAELTKNSGIDEWLQCALQNQYLPEAIIKKLCEMCKELLMEGRISHLSHSCSLSLQLLMYHC